MKFQKIVLGCVFFFFLLTSTGLTEDFPLQHFLAKVSSRQGELSEEEKIELLNRMEEVIGKAIRISRILMRVIQTEELQMEYQEGSFWMSKLEEDRASIETGRQQLKLLREKSTHLIASIELYKSLRDLSSHFNAYNDTPLFSAYIGDLAPEMELWADPVFYRLYLLPLALLKDKEPEPTSEERTPTPEKRKR